jgi:hypothetical protein
MGGLVDKEYVRGGLYTASDAETRTFHECLLASRAIYNEATRAA